MRNVRILIEDIFLLTKKFDKDFDKDISHIYFMIRHLLCRYSLFSLSLPPPPSPQTYSLFLLSLAT